MFWAKELHKAAWQLAVVHAGSRQSYRVDEIFDFESFLDVSGYRLAGACHPVEARFAIYPRPFIFGPF
jgi:hypothetical protein